MFKKIVIFVIFVFTFALLSNCAEIKWFKGDLNKALETAKKENKIVMIDFFTDWCTPCKILDKMVWQDEEAAKEISKLNIIPMKLDAEKEGLENAKKYKITAYPTIIFIDKNGDEVGRKVGFGYKEEILKSIKDNSKNVVSVKELKEIYQKEPENLEVAYDLAKKLIETEKEEAEKIFKKIYELDKDNQKGYGSKALIQRALLGFQDLSMQLYSIRNLWLSSQAKNHPPLEILWDEKPLNFDDVKSSIEFLYKGIIAKKKDEITKALKSVENKIKNIDLNIKDCDFDFNTLNGLYNQFNDDEWRDVQDAVVDIQMLFANFMTAEDLNNIAWHNYQTQRRLEESLNLSEKSCQLSDEPNLLDTKAHLLMSLGQKEKAIEVEKMAIEKLQEKKNSQMVEVFEKEIQLFEKNELGQLRKNVYPKNSNLKRAE
jgi:thiol-disulfide isomerase/thioredoxin